MVPRIIPAAARANASPNQCTIRGTVAGASEHNVRNLGSGNTRVLSVMFADLQHHWMQAFEDASDADSVVQGDDNLRARSKGLDRVPVSGNDPAAADLRGWLCQA